MTEKEFHIQKGDNDLYQIYYKDKYQLTMRYKSEAQIVVDYLNINEIAFDSLRDNCNSQEDLIRTLQWQNWALRRLLEDNDIEYEKEIGK